MRNVTNQEDPFHQCLPRSKLRSWNIEKHRTYSNDAFLELNVAVQPSSQRFISNIWNLMETSKSTAAWGKCSPEPSRAPSGTLSTCNLYPWSIGTHSYYLAWGLLGRWWYNNRRKLLESTMRLLSDLKLKKCSVRSFTIFVNTFCWEATLDEDVYSSFFSLHPSCTVVPF